jgi:hypothetical protein
MEDEEYTNLEGTRKCISLSNFASNYLEKSAKPQTVSG